MHSDKPLVSAVITTKDRAPLLQRALRSVAEQTYRPLEVVVVDDGSADETPRVVQTFRRSWDAPFRYIRNQASAGACRARNQGIEAASGTFVAGLDDDDEWLPRRLELLMQAWEPSAACVTSDVIMQYPGRRLRWHKPDRITLNTLLFSNQVGNQVLVLRERLLAVGGFDESLRAAQDYDLWVRLCAAYGPIINVGEPLQVIHAEHGGDRITNSPDRLEGYLAFYLKHKHKMNRAQRKYQLFNIRRAQGKQQHLSGILRWVPPGRYLKEIKRWVLDRYLTD